MRHFSPVLSAILFTALSGAALLAQTGTPPPPPQDATPQATSPSDMSQPDRQITGRPHHAPNPKHQARVMAKKLGLSADQQSQLEPILADRDQQMQSLYADTSLAPRDRHQKMKALRDDSQQKISAILTPAQQQEFVQMQQEQHGHHHGDPNAAAPQTPPSGN